MLEKVQKGRKLDKAAFASAESRLRVGLLSAQRALADAGVPVIIVVAGIEGAGKGALVNRLNEWLDARFVRSHAFWDETSEQLSRPPHWQFWRVMPPRGRTAILLGSWYARPIVAHTFKALDDESFELELRYVERLEETLASNGALIVKLWLHLPKRSLERMLRKEAEAKTSKHRLPPNARKLLKRYDRFMSASERAIAATDTPDCPWHLVDARDRRYRELTAGEVLLRACQQRLGDSGAPAQAPPPDRAPPEVGHRAFTVLDKVDLGESLDKDDYERRLRRQQHRLFELGWRARERGVSTVAVFEGWDAAGKGGAIRRLSAGLDARLHQIITVGAPSDEEKAQHYLWRFWRHVPPAGFATVFDRSWYGRVLVERVEAFAARDEWQRAYQEINDFEAQLVDRGIVVLKFWLHISPEEQLARFEERERTPWKRHKLTPDDWRNRERWADYEAAVEDMVALTSTEEAPWTIVAANNKRHARVTVLKQVADQLGRRVGD